RLSQRQPLACVACTKSKVRCDKHIPCARCFRRNTPCERETVELSRRRRRKSAFGSRATDEEWSLLGKCSIPAEVPDGMPFLPELRANSVTSSLRENPNPSHRAPSLSAAKVPQDVASAQVKFEDLATCIEGLAWGRHQCHKYPHRNCLRFGTQHDTSMRGPLAEDLLEKLPDVATARRMIEFHVRLLSWYHNVLHIPTFLAQCETFWRSAYIEDGQWLAMYCAVLSASAWSIHNSPGCQDCFDVLHTCPSPTELFSVVGNILNVEDFMSRHTIFSLQAICISGMVANVLGKSDLLITWLNASIRIAQCLGLHRIGDETSGDTWSEAVEKEIGRRVWLKLVELDYHSIPYTGTYSISLKHCSTKPPGNCNDDFQPQNEAILTASTYTLTQAKMAVLIPALLDGPSAGDDVASRYEHVIAIDRQMRQLVAGIPTPLLRQSSSVASNPEWLTLARRTLAIAAADKIIMIHRAFLLKSFQSPAYLFTRQTCVSAARTILREHDEISKAGPECPPIWIHSAFCVAAIVVICLELLYCHSTMSTERKDNYVQLIRGARQRLNLSNNDTMAHKGVHLVDAMLNEE
ncbi:uncharacterized protein CC84DRAFT_1053897, partial [Paraphaeosphaeria sporulosa]